MSNIKRILIITAFVAPRPPTPPKKVENTKNY